MSVNGFRGRVSQLEPPLRITFLLQLPLQSRSLGCTEPYGLGPLTAVYLVRHQASAAYGLVW